MGKAHDWHTRTSAVYAIANPARMQSIFPNGLKPFKGKKDNIILAISTLSQNIGADANPTMAAIKAEVDASFSLINPDRSIQKIAITTTGITSSDLDAACDACMIMEYRNSGILMDKHSDNIDNIQESFHDMELLLGKPQTNWNIHLNANENKDIATRTQVFNSKFKAKVVGGNAKMYLSSIKNGTDSTAVDLIDGHEKKFTAEDFHITDYGTYRHITVVNQSGVEISFSLKLG